MQYKQKGGGFSTKRTKDADGSFRPAKKSKVVLTKGGVVKCLN